MAQVVAYESNQSIHHQTRNMFVYEFGASTDEPMKFDHPFSQILGEPIGPTDPELVET